MCIYITIYIYRVRIARGLGVSSPLKSLMEHHCKVCFHTQIPSGS